MQPSLVTRVREYLGTPVDGGSMAVFRIGFGALTAWMIYGLVKTGPSGHSAVDLLFTPPETTWTFPYPGLSWLKPYPEPWTTVLFWGCLTAACLVSVGLMYRIASVVLCLAYWHIVLMDATLFGNHFPLIGVFTVLLAVTPAHRRYSLDRLLAAVSRGRTGPTTVTFWNVLLVRAQTFLIYFYGGVSKLHEDWLAGQPIRMWLSPEGLYPFFGEKLTADQFNRLTDFMSNEAVVYLFSYGGLIFDLSIGFLLCIRRTRWLAVGLATGFHLFNYFVIQRVGLVAPIAFWATLTFFEPDWPTRMWRFLKHPHLAKPDLGWLIAGAIVLPGIGALLGWKASPRVEHPPEHAVAPLRWPIFMFGLAWIAFQALFPARHLLMDTDPYWSDRGVRFSWFLMTRNKIGGLARIRVEDPQLVRQDAEGHARFDWERFQGEKPPVVYYSVDAPTVSWSELPELFVTFEPMIGERIFFNPAAAGLVKTEDIKGHVEELWQATYGRSCELYATYPLARQLRTLRRNAAIALRAEEPDGRAFLAAVLRAEERAKSLQAPNLDDDAFHYKFYTFSKSLFELRMLGSQTANAVKVLVQVSPFALQGNRAGGLRPFLIHDPQLMLTGRYVSLRLDREKWRGEQTAHADFDTVPWPFLEGLPLVLPTYRTDKAPSFIWNYSVELNPHQIEALEIMPQVLYSYAQHIAQRWQVEQGHRPRVFGTSFMVLNDRPMQKSVDPQVDLAATPPSIFGPTPWVLPPPLRPADQQPEE